jgi:hypothetical protein
MNDPLKRVNFGCGQTPTPGWTNYDNSLSILLARFPFAAAVAERLGLLSEGTKRFISFARSNEIIWADATKNIPLPDNSVEVLYASHLLEHLDRAEAKIFLQEAHRVLSREGILRIAVPDLKKLVDEYIARGDADAFIEKTLLARPMPKSLLGRVKQLLIGDRHHLWMYDSHSLCRLLSALGFRESRIAEPGSTAVPNPGELNLYERADESVYVEAIK